MASSSTTLSLSVPNARPPLSERTVSIPYIDELISNLKPLLKEPYASLFENCFPNTLDTTVLYHTTTAPYDTFVITGDIEALWLRDSTNQMLTYVPYISYDQELSVLVQGLISRQANSVLLDSFANSFNYNASGAGHQNDKRTPPMTPSVFEGKYEIDSLCAFLKLSYWTYRYADDDGKLFKNAIATDTWVQAATRAVDTIVIMQSDDGQSANPPYLFQRETSQATDTLMMSGRGPPCNNAKKQLSRSLFRPSDDAVTMSYNIPGNAMACVELNHLVELVNLLNSDSSSVQTLLSSAKAAAESICQGLSEVLSEAKSTSILPFEVDGYGGKVFMDDANIPSLLSLPILGYLSDKSSIYASTRKAMLSKQNPFYYAGSEGQGIGGPHVGPNFAWPMALMVQALTATKQSESEVDLCLQLLSASSVNTGFMHESFDVNNLADYTRPWFAWANGLYGELILAMVLEHPALVLVSSENNVTAAAQALVRTPVSLMAKKEVIVK